MFSLGTGLMRLANFALMGIAALLLIWAAWSGIKENYRDQGRDEIKEEVQTNNEKLDRVVIELNDNITRRVVNETEIIDRRSRQVEEAINDQPTEVISNVSRTHVDLVREQQRDIREASQKSK